jgi:hypothetical protein
MTAITIQDGAVVVRDGQVGTEQACCCSEEEPVCDLSAGEEVEQQAVSMTTDCTCEAGTLDGEYQYDGHGLFGYTWSGQSTCDASEFTEFFAPVSISVDNNCNVSMSTYQVGDGGFQTGISGSVDGTGIITVDNDGNLVGSISVPLSNFAGVQCTASLVFGA